MNLAVFVWKDTIITWTILSEIAQNYCYSLPVSSGPLMTQHCLWPSQRRKLMLTSLCEVCFGILICWLEQAFLQRPQHDLPWPQRGPQGCYHGSISISKACRSLKDSPVCLCVSDTYNPHLSAVSHRPLVLFWTPCPKRDNRQVSEG